MSARFAFESFGVQIVVDVIGSAGPQLVPAVEAVLPPGRRSIPLPAEPEVTASLTVGPRSYTVTGPDGQSQVWRDQGAAVHALDREVRAAVSLRAPGHVFIHAGVVAGSDGACVIPGASFAGKTTLVAALVAAGATYLSDEYAVIDPDGSVVPYARPLSMRTPAGRSDVSPGTLGRIAPPVAVPAVLVVSTAHRPGASWAPEAGTEGDCALALIANAVAARSRPADVLAAASAVSRHARYLHGDRGDATETAPAILRLLGGPQPARASAPGARSIPAPPGALTLKDHQ